MIDMKDTETLKALDEIVDTLNKHVRKGYLPLTAVDTLAVRAAREAASATRTMYTKSEIAHLRLVDELMNAITTHERVAVDDDMCDMAQVLCGWLSTKVGVDLEASDI